MTHQISQLRKIKSYVLRSGRMSPRQQHGLEQLLPKYEVPKCQDSIVFDSSNHDSITHWNLIEMFSRTASTYVEIGFGMGATLVSMAIQRPQDNFIGVEVHRSGIGSLAADLFEKDIKNVRIAPFDAVSVFEKALPANSIDGIYIFFPDPWPKKRHHKRRLVQADFVRKIIPALKPGGFIHCATDWQEYADEILLTLNANSQLVNKAEEGGFISRPQWRPLTRFESRGLKLGHGVWDILFIKK